MSASKPTVGVVGFGSFGQFIAARLVKAGYRVLATSRSPYQSEAAALGVEFHQSADAFSEAAPDVVLLATSILSTDKVLAALPLHKLSKDTLFVDVLSVKAYPKALLKSVLPPEADILCTHPMFGPVSGCGSWAGLTFMYDAVRVADTAASQSRLQSFLDFWAAEGCRMVQMSCEEHDRQAASTQFITHTVGRMLGAMDVASTDINTKGYESLLQLVQNTNGDSFDLYYGLFLYNNNALSELERMEQALAKVKNMLLDQLHEIARQHLMGAAAVARAQAPISNNNILPFRRSSSGDNTRMPSSISSSSGASPAGCEARTAAPAAAQQAMAAVAAAAACNSATSTSTSGFPAFAECPSDLAAESFNRAGQFAALRSADIDYSAFAFDNAPTWMPRRPVAPAPAAARGGSVQHLQSARAALCARAAAAARTTRAAAAGGMACRRLGL